MAGKTLKIVVLGGSGFIGAHVLRALSGRADVDLHWVRRHATPSPDIDGLPAPVLIEDLEAVDIKWLSDADVIVDLVSRGRGRMVQTRDINLRIRPHLRIIDGLINAGSRAHYILLSSGGAVYGTTSEAVIHETHLCSPQTEYGLEKAIVEMHLQAAAQTTLEATILRVTNAYGLGQPIKPGFGVIPTMVSAMDTGTPFRVFGSGEMQRDYVNVIDVRGAIEAAIKVGGSGIVNIGTGQGTSINDLIALVQELSGRELALEFVESGTEPGFAQLDTTRAREVLGWTPTISLHDGVREILEAAGLARA
ncbi:NAD-dependent epimerase/dehydratase family protein [Pseudaestuariivita atlantica]|uniref:NAD-dependent epimerase/dehydratase domain-containing protein n=1 Tax=Pseudaestuariivita atlantica TaxID=1317121 RepID=A0A0L1JU17_9RHOB|nr:NAD-dependent epimerase/dehydratase family protein [Pseudaestuariivita atlantica]KNG95245.1 hypothetical protein ATO11_00975 [Pseudaestuariivita atlantica]